jgi:hypothetical protein
METNDAVALLPAVYAATDCGYGASDLMSEYLGRRDEAMLYLLQVCPADTAGGHLNQNLTVGDFRHRYMFGRHAPRSAIHSRTHFPG